MAGVVEMRGGAFDADGNKAEPGQADDTSTFNTGGALSGFSPTGNPNWVPTGPPMEYFKASSDNGDYGNGGKRKFGKGIARMEYDAAPKLLYNAPIHTSVGQCCCGMITNPQVSGRSYIWVMENRLETNMATGCHPMCGPAEDAIEVKVELRAFV